MKISRHFKQDARVFPLSTIGIPNCLRGISVYQCFFIALYSLIAFRSPGYFHADEHYQIIEFAHFIINDSHREDLPWEFHEKMRSALLPLIAAIVMKTLMTFGISDPFTLTTFLRLLTLVFSIFTLNKVYSYVRSKSPGTPEIQSIFLTYGLWFIPTISARFCSETWSGLFLVNGVLALLSMETDRKNKPFGIAALFSVAFLCRFQVAFALVGILAWLIATKTYNKREYTLFAAGLITPFFAGILLDSWVYNELGITALNYAHSFFSNTAPSSFDGSPWHRYFGLIIRNASIVTALPVMIMAVYAHFTIKQNIFSWATLSFILPHLLISHKEVRFLVPIAFLIPVLMSQTLNSLTARAASKRLKAWSVGIYAFFGFQTIGMLVALFTPVGDGYGQAMRYLDTNFRHKNLTIVSPKWANPYDPWQGLEARFYMWEGLTLKDCQKICECLSEHPPELHDHIYIMRRIDREKAECDLSTFLRLYERTFETHKSHVVQMSRFFGRLDRQNSIEVWIKRE